MKLLLAAPHYPFFDRSSGDLRLFHIIRALASTHRLWFCPLFERAHARKIGEDENARYRTALENIGITVSLDGPRAVMREIRPDAILFEFFFAALPWLKEARTLCPNAHVIVDSVDVHFHRLGAKARLTGSAEDSRHADSIMSQEIGAYAGADLVVVVTDEDGLLVRAEVPATPVATIPNIHVMHKPVDRAQGKELTFVGGFAHEPNTDAVLWFVREILPLVREQHPDAVFNVIGNAPPTEVQELASEHVRVLGYVPDIEPYLRRTLVSVAPLRYGAGMKGKIGEAMSFGLPVVTTDVGVEGFGLTPEENVLVGNEPREFARHIVRLIDDDALRLRIAGAGWRFIDERYSDRVVTGRVRDLFGRLANIPIKRVSMFQRARHRLLASTERAAWRIRG